MLNNMYKRGEIPGAGGEGRQGIPYDKIGGGGGREYPMIRWGGGVGNTL